MTVVRRDDPYEVELSGVEVGLLWMAIFSQAQKEKIQGIPDPMEMEISRKLKPTWLSNTYKLVKVNRPTLYDTTEGCL